MTSYTPSNSLLFALDNYLRFVYNYKRQTIDIIGNNRTGMGMPVLLFPINSNRWLAASAPKLVVARLLV